MVRRRTISIHRHRSSISRGGGEGGGAGHRAEWAVYSSPSIASLEPTSLKHSSGKRALCAARAIQPALLALREVARLHLRAAENDLLNNRLARRRRDNARMASGVTARLKLRENETAADGTRREAYRV